MNIETLIDRIQAVRDVGISTTARQRIASAAQELESEAYNQMRIEILNEALFAFSKAIYTVDSTGRFVHVDVGTYRIMVAKPWASGGWERWGLKQWESRVMRNVLITRSNMRRVAPLFDYDSERRQWYLNVPDYSNADAAISYWKRSPITLAEWHRFADILRKAAHDRTLRKGERVNSS